ncbi:MAG TPA: cytochrome c oxidase subunit II [Humisphaera sp.]
MTSTIASIASRPAAVLAGWLPERASTFAGPTDGLFDFILWVCGFFLALVAVLMVVLVVRYRHRDGARHDPTAGHSNLIEIVWTAVPTLIVIGIFYVSIRQFIDRNVEPAGAYEITATGRMWQWSFTYADGYQDNDVVPADDRDPGFKVPVLHVPANVPVKVLLDSKDVIHSLSIPAFRVKKDVVPGRYNTVWFQPTEPGTYDVYCAGYCGTAHSAMAAKVVVHDPASFAAWMAESKRRANDVPPVELGQKVYRGQGCVSCHSVDGSKIVGPTWKDLYGSTVPLADGTTVTADDAYVRESIAKPAAKVHAGFAPVMPAYALKDREVAGVIAYMKSISGVGGKPAATTQAAATQPTTAPTTQP